MYRCEKCNKQFSLVFKNVSEYVYKVRISVQGKPTTLYFCSYTCWRAYQKNTTLKRGKK